MTIREKSLQKELPVLYRAAEVVEKSVNDEDRTVELIWTTGAQRLTWSWSEWDVIMEQLLVTEEACDLSRLNAGAPLLNAHNSWSLSSQIGVIEKAWISEGVGYAKVRFSRRPDVDPIWQDVKDRIIRNVSVGYTVQEYRVTYEEGKPPYYLAVRWQPCEISPVPIPADPGAQFRARAQEQKTAHPCIIRFQDAPNTRKETPAMSSIIKRALAEADRTFCRDILKEYGVKEEQLDECLDKILAKVESPAEEDEEAKDEMAMALGCNKRATTKEMAAAAKTFRELYDLTSKQEKEEEANNEDNTFVLNEAKGMHRKIGSDLAKRLFTSNRSLYDEEMKKVTPLSQRSPTAPRSMTKLTEASSQAEQFAAECQRRMESSKDASGKPALSYGDAYSQVSREWEKAGKMLVMVAPQ